jgi:hypothetical protein
MAGKEKAKPKVQPTPTDAEMAAADAVRAARQAARAAKAAAAQEKAAVRKAAMGRHADRHKNAFGIAGSAAKATSVSRNIVSRNRGGRGR